MTLIELETIAIDSSTQLLRLGLDASQLRAGGGQSFVARREVRPGRRKLLGKALRLRAQLQHHGLACSQRLLNLTARCFGGNDLGRELRKPLLNLRAFALELLDV